MAIDTDAAIARNRERELRENLEKISKKLTKGGNDSTEALYQLQEVLDRSDTFGLAGKINPRLVSVVWILKKFIHDLWTNMGGDNPGFPKDEGTQILQDIARHLGVFIQNSLFRNRPRDSIGTFEDVIKSYYALLHLAEEYYKKEDRRKEFVVL
ncbi:MAG: hypothetical protein Q8N37_02915 [bacterium]|nr:hypothetical protein [bacterium]